MGVQVPPSALLVRTEIGNYPMKMIEKISLMNRARLEKRISRDISVVKTAEGSFEKFRKDPIFLSGIALYWAEGTRLNKNYRKYQLAFTNSDSKIINFYCNFLGTYFCNKYM